MYAIIDVETTGLDARTEKITEIAILLHDGTSIVEKYTTLVNPEKKIPYRITQLTGINNKMVEEAPRFYEIAKDVIEITEGKTLVGHNVAFDYNFIRNEFKSLGYEYSREKLCTVKMSRKLIPLRPSYGLGKLCKDLNIENPSRHRAEGDATATSKLFEFLLHIDPSITDITLKGLNSNLSKEKLCALTEETGVYYFYNNDNDIIYVGKSINIKDRVLSHLSNNTSKKEIELKNNIADVSYVKTGSELVALLLESDEIKKHKPLFNRAQRRSVYTCGLHSFYDKDGYLQLKIDKNEANKTPHTAFSNQVSGKEFLFSLAEKFQLCQKLCGLYKTKHSCFQYHIKECKGACKGEEPPEEYNARVLQALEPFTFSHDSFLVVDKGRDAGEKSIILIENGKYVGFGFIEKGFKRKNLEKVRSHILSYRDNRDVQQIIRSYLRNNEEVEVVEL